MKSISIVKKLAQKYGGKWTYNRSSGSWHCDDGIRYVCNVLTGKDYEGEYTGESTMCMYFKDGRSSKWVY